MSSLRTPPAIEPLSDLSWHRIERGLFERLDQTPVTAPEPRVRVWRMRWPALAGFSAAAAIAAVLAIIVLGPDDAGPVLQTSRVETADAATQVSLEDAGLTVAPHSTLLINRTSDRGVLVVLERGRVDCRVAPRHGRPPFVVQSGRVRVEVVGTRFAVARHGDSARVTVTEGLVAVIDDGRRVEVGAGEAWPGETAALSGDDRTDPAEAADETARRPARKPARRKRPRTDRPGATGERSAAARSAVGATDATDATDQPAAGRPTAKQIFTQAASLEGSDPARALALYRELVKHGGAWAAPALYAQGRLQLERGREAAARKLLERYLARYPDGANAADARRLLGSMSPP